MRLAVELLLYCVIGFGVSYFFRHEFNSFDGGWFGCLTAVVLLKIVQLIGRAC